MSELVELLIGRLVAGSQLAACLVSSKGKAESRFERATLVRRGVSRDDFHKVRSGNRFRLSFICEYICKSDGKLVLDPSPSSTPY